ncbi:methionyl-tRNA ligase [endosymbiont of Acanthamoeba sp. UWC8]|uniref:methionine--tRNA ligase n=1 Tax=endosymbiont of Acanthamoeba sp. UWC8 TaxID=86106 RepID=UPI0004D14465|nr:methionine--tRNA ligase [endosymbiont of Acanthamoeba sp. UWC8]AIF81233.1 methionyl-tRNA ligase [endosymbiont of Acanthamoeba sp. UWC8]
MSVKPKFYITTPIYYVNDIPHIGHAYTSLACDILARFKRLDGFDVMFLTGTDEHGQKIEKSAVKAGKDPQAFTDKVYVSFKNLSQTMNFSNDDFIRTSEERHKKYVAEIWQRLVDSGNIYLGKYSGWYAVRDEAFYSESELVDGKAPTGADVEWLEEPSYFFKLSAWQDKLLKLYEESPNFIAPPSRRNEVISFVKSGLTDLSVSRTSFKWGIPVPGDEQHVIYVWLDALFNYISALGGENSHYWPCDLHVVGKDILRFHAVYWPAFLMAAGIELPKKVFAHGWWTNEGVKISKSLGNTINPVNLVEEFGLDYVRYFMMKEVPFGNDGNYSRSSFISRVNADLANNIGNLSQRVLSFIYKNCEMKVPYSSTLNDKDVEFLNFAYQTIDKIRKEIDQQGINHAIQFIIDLSAKANEYIDREAPWNLRKTDVERMGSVLYTLAEVIRVIAILLQPIMPDASGKILDILNVKERSFNTLNKDFALKEGHEINEPFGVFPRLEG